MYKKYILIGGTLLLLLISITVKENSNKNESIPNITPKEITIKSIELIELEKNLTQEIAKKAIFIEKVKVTKETKSLTSKEKLLSQIDAIASNKIEDISFLTDNLSQLFECQECLDKLTILLASSEINQDIIERLANAIGSMNTKESAELLLKAMALNIEAENQDNIGIIENSFSNFDSAEVATLFASVLFESSENQIISSTSLSENTRYAMEKVINSSSERDLVASDLADIYNSATEDEQKDKIANLNHPEMYAIIALESSNQGDAEQYNMMIDNLIKTPKKESINALMLLARKSEPNSIADITEVATKWSQNNSSEQSVAIAEDYLSRGYATPQERMIASALLSSSPNGKKILDKALKHEENGEVVIY